MERKIYVFLFNGKYTKIIISLNDGCSCCFLEKLFFKKSNDSNFVLSIKKFSKETKETPILISQYPLKNLKKNQTDFTAHCT